MARAYPLSARPTRTRTALGQFASPYFVASALAALNVYPHTPRAARALAPRLARNLPQCQGHIDPLPHPSEPDVDERPLPDLGDPLLESRVVLFAVEDVANLAAGLCQRVARERLLRVEMEQVIADGRPCRRRRLPGLEAKDRLLDLRRELSSLERAQAAAVLRRGILRILLGERREVLPFLHLPVDLLGLLARRGPAVLPLAGPGQEQDVARLEREAGLELAAVRVDVSVDLLLGDRDAEGDL